MAYIPIFFLASGFMIKEDVDMSKKSKRLLIPYFVYGIILFSIDQLIVMATGGELEICKITGLLYGKISFLKSYDAEHILLTPYLRPLWFLPCMFIAFVYYKLYLIAKTHSNISGYIVLTIPIIFSMICTKLPYQLPMSMDVAGVMCVLLLLGKKLKDHIFMNLSSLCMSILIFILLAYVNGENNLSVCYYGKNGVLSALLIVPISILYFLILSNVFMRSERFFVVKIFAFLGRHSLRLMCIHLFIFAIADDFLYRINLNLFIIDLPIAILSVIAIEKMVSKYKDTIPYLSYI
jgi:hypothetical protein